MFEFARKLTIRKPPKNPSSNTFHRKLQYFAEEIRVWTVLIVFLIGLGALLFVPILLSGVLIAFGVHDLITNGFNWWALAWIGIGFINLIRSLGYPDQRKSVRVKSSS